MGQLVYNGVYLPYSDATEFRQEAVYDELGGVDRVYTKFDIKCQGLLNADYLSTIDPTLAGVTKEPAEIMSLIRQKLLKPRRALAYRINDRELLPVPQGNLPGPIDARNGPQPQSCVITELTNTTFLFTYHVTAHYWENSSPATVPPDNRSGNDVLWNRWTETVEIDERNYTRRIRDGKFVIRTDNVTGRIADTIRSQMAVVSVPGGFNRVSARYTVDPSGLGIAYSIVDQEVFKHPPRGAFKAAGEYVETASGGANGAYRFGECRVILEGSKDSNQALLLKAAVIMVRNKIKSRGARLLLPVVGGIVGGGIVAGTPAIDLMQAAMVKVDLFENKVEASLRVRYKSDKLRVQGIAGFAGVGTDTPLSTAEGPVYRDRGTASILLQAAAYYDPSLQGVILGQENIRTPDNPDTPTGDQRVQLNVPNGRQVGQAGLNPEP